MLGKIQLQLIIARLNAASVDLETIWNNHADRAIKSMAYSVQTKLQNLIDELEERKQS